MPVTSTAALLAALKRAKPGDTLLAASSSYAALSLKEVAFEHPGVTIAALATFAPAA